MMIVLAVGGRMAWSLIFHPRNKVFHHKNIAADYMI